MFYPPWYDLGNISFIVEVLGIGGWRGLSGEDDYMKRMADALRSGARMLSEQCPICGSPLFEIKGQIWCLKCNKRVIKVRGDEEVKEAMATYVLSEVHRTLATKIEEVSVMLSRAVEADEIRSLAETLNILLKAMEQNLKLRTKLEERERE